MSETQHQASQAPTGPTPYQPGPQPGWEPGAEACGGGQPAPGPAGPGWPESPAPGWTTAQQPQGPWGPRPEAGPGGSFAPPQGLRPAEPAGHPAAGYGPAPQAPYGPQFGPAPAFQPGPQYYAPPSPAPHAAQPGGPFAPSYFQAGAPQGPPFGGFAAGGPQPGPDGGHAPGSCGCGRHESGPGAQAGPPHPGMDKMFGLMGEIMNGTATPASFGSLLSGCSEQFWKGLLVGAGVTFLLTSPAVRESIGGAFGSLFGFMGGQAASTANEESEK